MKRFGLSQWRLLALLFVSMNVMMQGQTQLQLGDLAFVHFDQVSAPRSFSFLSRTFIDQGTVFYISNRDWSNSNGVFSGTNSKHADLKISIDEPLSPGQPFNIEYGAGIVNSDLVSANYEVGNDFEFSNSTGLRKLWIYQLEGTDTVFITGVLWNGTVSDVPKALASTDYLFDLEVSGASTKCGCISETIPQFNLTDNIKSNFYDKSNWSFSNNNSQPNPPCNQEDFFNVVKNNIQLDLYRYGHPQDRTGANGTSTSMRWTGGTASQNINEVWSDLTSGPDWATETAVRRVEIHEDYSLSGQRAFTCASLFIAAGKTLTLEPGAILAVGQTLDNNGTIHCKSGMVGSDKLFAQIAPTNAELNGIFIYDVLINNPEWHHFMSPIVSSLGNIQFIDPSNNQSSAFALNYTGPTANVYRWNAGDAQINAGWALTSGSTADFSAEPYTILFPQSVLPLIMRVEGTALLEDPNVDQQKSADNGAGVSSSPGFGAPGWRDANVNGWNFYGNPYLSFISSQRTVANFGTNMTSVSHPVYTYQPFRNSSTNVANNYHTFNGTTGDEQANNIPPFQAFFMQHVNSGGGTSAVNNNGPKFGKRSRLSQNPTAGSFVQFRTTSAAKTKLALDLYHQTPNPEATLYLDLRDDMQQVERNIYKDAVFNGDVHKMFGIYFDSSCYVIKCAPNHLDSLHQKVAMVYRNHGAGFSIANHPDFNTDYESFLYDRYANTMHNLSQGAYSFVNDTTQQDYRFDWFLAPRNLGIFRVFEQAAPSWVWWSVVDNTVALFTESKRQEEEGRVVVFDLNGKKMFEQTGVIHQMRLPAQSSGKQAIVVINREKAIKIQFP